MGVWELESYISNKLENGVQEIYIDTEIKEFGKKLNGQKPILVFDVMSLVGIFKDVEVSLCGGNYQMYMQELESLFLRLSGAELVFFMDGFVRNRKRLIWTRRQQYKYMESIAVLDMIYSQRSLHAIGERFSSFYFNTVLNVIEEACKKFGRLIYTVDYECDQEIAWFAFQNKRVLGIFSNDTDFMIFRGDWRYFSTRDLTFDTLRTKEFNRKALRDHLKLSDGQLAVFSTVVGNDFFLQSDLKKLHDRLKLEYKNKFLALAKYVRETCKKADNQDMLIKSLSFDIYGNTKENNLSRLWKSFDFYNINCDVELTQDDLLRNHYLFTYNVLNKSPFNFSAMFYDFRYGDFPPYYDLCVPMLQRQAGIVFWMSPTPDAFVTVYIKTSHTIKPQKFELPPIFPQIEVPFLEELYSDDPMLDSLRFTLLKWSIDWEKLKDFYIEDFPDNYMIDILTLTFMKQRGVISAREADIFLWVIKNAENRTIPNDLALPKYLKHRPFRLAFLYVKLFSNVARSIEVCGLKKKYWKACNFNGVFFHHEYERFSVEPFDAFLLLNEL